MDHLGFSAFQALELYFKPNMGPLFCLEPLRTSLCLPISIYFQEHLLIWAVYVFWDTGLTSWYMIAHLMKKACEAPLQLSKEEVLANV